MMKENILKKPALSLETFQQVCVKFSISTGPAWELWPKPIHYERRLVPSRGT